MTVERCARTEHNEPKHAKSKAAAAGADADGVDGGGKGNKGGKKQKPGCKTNPNADNVEGMVAQAVELSEGTLEESDFDGRIVSFLKLLPAEVATTALREIKKQATKAPSSNRCRYFMGIIKKVSKKSWDESEHGQKRPPPGKRRPNPGRGGGGKFAAAKMRGAGAEAGRGGGGGGDRSD